MQIAAIFRAQIVDVGAKSLILQVIGDTEKIDALEKLLRQYRRQGVCPDRHDRDSSRVKDGDQLQ